MSNTASPDSLTPPPVAPVPAGTPRPLWSVMIPTFNCANYLRLTLASVLTQAPGPDEMQIEVVDDCSTKDDPEAVVREVGQGRVTFYRKPKNGGAIANFNTCIERSRGQLVHILHGDDLVLPGFYERYTATARAHPNAALIACRSFFIDEEGVITGVSDRVRTLENEAKDASDFYYATAIQTASAVVRRSFYEQHGGFILPLVHTADCEMWSRAAGMGGGIVLKEPLCQYRVFAANDSGRLARTAENFRDLERLNKIFAQRHSDFNPARAAARLELLSAAQLERFRQKGDAEAYAANLAYWRATVPLSRRAKQGLIRFARSVLGSR